MQVEKYVFPLVPKTHDPRTEWVVGTKHDVGTEDTKDTWCPPARRPRCRGNSWNWNAVGSVWAVKWARQATNMPAAGEENQYFSPGRWGCERRWVWDWVFICERHVNRPWVGRRATQQREEQKKRSGLWSLGEARGCPQEPRMGSEGCSHCLDNRTHLFLLQCLSSGCLWFGPSHYQP